MNPGLPMRLETVTQIIRGFGSALDDFWGDMPGLSTVLITLKVLTSRCGVCRKTCSTLRYESMVFESTFRLDWYIGDVTRPVDSESELYVSRSLQVVPTAEENSGREEPLRGTSREDEEEARDGAIMTAMTAMTAMIAVVRRPWCPYIM